MEGKEGAWKMGVEYFPLTNPDGWLELEKGGDEGDGEDGGGKDGVLGVVNVIPQVVGSKRGKVHFESIHGEDGEDGEVVRGLVHTT